MKLICVVIFELLICSSSQSGSSSNSSRSPSPTTRRRRYSSTNNSGHKSPVRGRHAKRSPSPELHKRRHSPGKLFQMMKWPNRLFNPNHAHFTILTDYLLIKMLRFGHNKYSCSTSDSTQRTALRSKEGLTESFGTH